jgi:hypothetical protein
VRRRSSGEGLRQSLQQTIQKESVEDTNRIGVGHSRFPGSLGGDENSNEGIPQGLHVTGFEEARSVFQPQCR